MNIPEENNNKVENFSQGITNFERGNHIFHNY